jgi:hypothetical protein
MNERETERRLRNWLDARAPTVVPDDLRGAVAAIPATVPVGWPDRLVAALGPRRAAVPRSAWVLLLLAGLLAALVGGMLVVGSQPARKVPAVIPLPTGVPPVGPAFACPPGSTPDAPGPVDQARPPSSNIRMAFDRASGKIVLIEGNGSVATWTFDVCTNTWTQMHPASEPYNTAFGMLAYDTAARRTISTSDSGGARAYDLASDTWTAIASDTWTARPGTVFVPGGARLVYDSGAARVVALPLESPHLMWGFDGVAGTWQPVDQDQDAWPDAEQDTYILLAYDASVDRLVSYYLGEVRLFDLRTGTWSPPGTTSPPFGYGGWGYSLGGEIAYDEAAQRTVLFNMGHVIAYDATADRWETLYGPPSDGGRADGFCGIRPECRNLHSMVYDPVNERLVVYGGHVHTGAVDPGWWGPSDDVLAFDTRTREWTVLLAASRSLTPVVSPSSGE